MGNALFKIIVAIIGFLYFLYTINKIFFNKEDIVQYYGIWGMRDEKRKSPMFKKKVFRCPKHKVPTLDDTKSDDDLPWLDFMGDEDIDGNMLV